jgi:pimeloyl-ACP methyl ester carboxylesterase
LLRVAPGAIVAPMPSLLDRAMRVSLERRRGFTSRTVATSKGGVHVLIGPRRAGPTLVLLHGMSASGVSYGPMLPHLLERVGRVVLPDLPGHGFSARPTKIDAEVVQGGLVEALDRVLDEPAFVFGNSLGGFVATRFALARPERVRGLVLASPAGTPSTQDEIDEVKRTFAVRGHRDALAFLDRLLARPDPRLRHVFALALRARFADPLIRALLDSVEVGAGIADHELRSLRPPTLLVWGAHDRILPERHRDFYREHLPAHAQRETPARFGHSPHLDNPRAISERVLAFIDEVVASEGQAGARASGGSVA